VALARHIVPRAVIGSFARPVDCIQPGDRLVIRTNCPGELAWRVDEVAPQTIVMVPVGGVMAGVRRYHATLGPFFADANQVRFRSRCTHPGCDGANACCHPDEHRVAVA
jgi:hypothetical protein